MALFECALLRDINDLRLAASSLISAAKLPSSRCFRGECPDDHNLHSSAEVIPQKSEQAHNA